MLINIKDHGQAILIWLKIGLYTIIAGLVIIALFIAIKFYMEQTQQSEKRIEEAIKNAKDYLDKSISDDKQFLSDRRKRKGKRKYSKIKPG